jgi:hypothetical protein
MARPIVWTEQKKKDAIEEILSQMFEGKSCRSILNSDRQNLPSHRVFIEWLANDTLLSKQYAYACEARADLIFDEIIEIADDDSGDRKVNEKTGEEVLDSEFVQRSRLKVDARKWAVSKMNPKKYGDKLDIDHTTKGEQMNIISLGNGIKPEADH